VVSSRLDRDVLSLSHEWWFIREFKKITEHETIHLTSLPRCSISPGIHHLSTPSINLVSVFLVVCLDLYVLCIKTTIGVIELVSPVESLVPCNDKFLSIVPSACLIDGIVVLV